MYQRAKKGSRKEDKNMTELKASTARGKHIVGMGERYEGRNLYEVYGRYSEQKAVAYQQCYDMYARDEHATAFSICSHNSFGFTVSWITLIDGENVMRVETKDNSYLVWLDR